MLVINCPYKTLCLHQLIKVFFKKIENFTKIAYFFFKFNKQISFFLCNKNFHIILPDEDKINLIKSSYY